MGWERVAVRCLFLFLCAEGEPASFHAAPAPPQASLCSTRPKRLLISQAKAVASASSHARSSTWCLVGIHIVHDDCIIIVQLIHAHQFIQSITHQSINKSPSNPIKTLQWSLSNQTAEPTFSPALPCVQSAARAVSPAIRKGCD